MATQYEKIKEQIQNEKEWEIMSFPELLKIEFRNQPFLVDPFIPQGGITYLVAHPNCGKTWLILETALCVSAGKDLFDHYKTTQTNVLIVDEESSQRETQRRIKMLSREGENPVMIMSLQGFNFETEGHIERLANLCKEKEIGLIIFDSLADVAPSCERDTEHANKFNNSLKKLTAEGITVLISHHNRKDTFMGIKDEFQSFRGPIALQAGADSVFKIISSKPGEAISMTLQQTKLREGKKSSEKILVNLVENNGKMIWEYVGEIKTEQDTLDKVKDAVIKDLKDNPGICASEITKHLIPMQFAPRTIQRAIKDLKESTQIKQTGKYGQQILLEAT